MLARPLLPTRSSLRGQYATRGTNAVPRALFLEIAQIVARVRELCMALLPARSLSCVYVLTNGRPKWLAELKDALQADGRGWGLDAWAYIATSCDLRLTREQQYNAQAMDMAVVQRADVILGNGVSVLRYLSFGFLLILVI
jgi:hypothetical protein